MPCQRPLGPNGFEGREQSDRIRSLRGNAEMTMGLFKKLFRSKPNENSVAFQQGMAEKVSNKHIKYVSERIDGVDTILGKNGSISLRDGYLLISAAGVRDILFRGEISTLKISELMSLDGAVIQGPDLEHGGAVRTLVAYYVYYR